MINDKSDILDGMFIFTESLTEAFDDRYLDHCLHIFCTQGSAQFRMDGNIFNLVAGHCIIKSSAKPVTDVYCSDDLQVFGVVISMDYLRTAVPNTSYDVGGRMRLHDDPIMPVPAEDMPRLRQDVEEIRCRFQASSHLFYLDTLRYAVCNMVYDLYDIHSRVNRNRDDGRNQPAVILERFTDLISTGIFRRERKVDYYASRLFITPKYLSECCMKASGHNASYWIEHFIIDNLTKELIDTDKTLTLLADEYGFSSLPHLSRYVKGATGFTPTEYRGKNRK